MLPEPPVGLISLTDLWEGRRGMSIRAASGRGAALAIAALVFFAPAAASAATFTVNTVGDAADPTPADGLCDVDPGAGNQCTLRSSINASNTSGPDDIIEFDFPTEPTTIGLANDLPAVTDAVLIDGYSEDGSAVNTGAGFSAFNAITTVAVDGNGHRT